MIRIGHCLVDPADGTVNVDGRVTRLEPKVMAVLVFLAERRGTVVSREELMRGVWKGTFVAPGALARSISILRHAIGDDARNPKFIETLPKRGYRLIAPIAATAVPPPGRPRRPAVFLGVAVTLSAWIAAGDGIARIQPSLRESAPRTLKNRGRLNNENALAHYQRVLATDPQSSDAHAGLATAYAFRAGYMPDAWQWARTAIDLATTATRLDPTSASAHKALGTAHLQAGYMARAIEEYRDALRLNPGNAYIQNNLGLAMQSLGRLAEALPLFERRIAAAPDDATGYVSFAETLWQAGQTDAALAVAARALLLEPYNHPVKMLVVRADLTGGRHSEARAKLEQQLAVDPGCAQCAVLLGLIDQVGGNWTGAERQYRRAMEISPGFTGGPFRLGHLRRLQGRHEESDALLANVVARATAAIGRGVETSGPRWQLAVAAAIRGDRDAALTWYTRALHAGWRDLTWDRWEPMLADLHLDPNFLDLSNRERFPEDLDAGRLAMQRMPAAMAAFDRRYGRLLGALER